MYFSNVFKFSASILIHQLLSPACVAWEAHAGSLVPQQSRATALKIGSNSANEPKYAETLVFSKGKPFQKACSLPLIQFFSEIVAKPNIGIASGTTRVT